MSAIRKTQPLLIKQFMQGQKQKLYIRILRTVADSTVRRWASILLIWNSGKYQK